MLNLEERAHEENEMKSEEDIDALEKLIGQLKAFHSEIGQLSKKSPNDGLSKFKIQLVNATLELANSTLGEKYSPFEGFAIFNTDDLPSNSDVTMVVAQYLEEAERYRSDNVAIATGGRYVYLIDGEKSRRYSAPPTWSKK